MGGLNYRVMTKKLRKIRFLFLFCLFFFFRSLLVYHENQVIRTIWTNLLKTYFHEFWIYKSTICFHEKCLIFFWRICKGSFFVKINSSRIVFISIVKLHLVLKKNKKQFMRKIRGFGIRENMSRTFWIVLKILGLMGYPLIAALRN